MSRRTSRPLLATCLMALMFVSAVPSAVAADTTSTVGWVRLAHLSPDTPAVDVYLYPFGGTTAQLVLKHVAYGNLSPYESLAPGHYLVAMRGAGAATTTNPVISTQVNVTAGQAYTVAGLGAASALTLQVLNDKLDTAQGEVSVRIIEASLRSPTASVSADSDTLATNLHFPNVTAYQTLDPGPRALKVSTQDADATEQLNFSGGSTYTLAILDGAGAGSAPQVLDLSDATGTSVMPKGGVNTGFGGTAQHGGPGSVLPAGWIVLLIAAVGAVGYAGARQRRK